MSSSSISDSQGPEESRRALSEAFRLLEKAFLTGRRVVPLFGAGISVDAGIPLVSTLRDYLTRVENYITLVLQEPSCDQFLKRQGWLERHDLNARILSSDQGPDRRNPTDPAKSWLEQLDRMIKGDQTLRDLFFLQFTRGRRAVSCHHSIACLAKLMNWPLILTTNFDNLIENALYEQGMQPTVYELTDQDKFPDPTLVVGNPAVVKLHGGVANLIAGYMLNENLDPLNRKKLLGYLPAEEPLLLALGYSGEDERVMSFVRQFCEEEGADGAPRALWIHRSDRPREKVLEILSTGRLRAARYADADRFLQELYARLTTTHPVSRVAYRVLAQVPPQTQWTVEIPEVERERLRDGDHRVVLFTRDTAPYGTSTALASDLTDWFPNHRLIWCDMEEIPTVDSLIDYIQNEIRRVDPEVPPFGLFRSSEPDRAVEDRRPTLQPQDDFETDPRVMRLVEALQRDKYLLVVDSMGEFGNSHVADFVSRQGAPGASKQRTDQLLGEHRRLRAFLLGLGSWSESFGESKLYIAHTYLTTGDGPRDEQIRVESDRFVSEMTGCPYSTQVPNPRPSDPPFLQPELKRLLTDESKRKLKTIRNESLDKQVSFVWEGLQGNHYRVLLAIASAFRRPRSLVALRRLAVPLLLSSLKTEESTRFSVEFFNMLVDQHSSIWNHNLRKEERQDIDSLVEELSGLGLLVRQEGGSFWMHRVVRNTVSQCILEEIRSCDDKGNREKALLGVGDLHDLIATYYYAQVFRQSNDPAAFFEYVFHRLASIRCADRARRNHRLQDLSRALTRHRDDLLSQGQASMLAGWITNIHEWEVRGYSQQHDNEGSKRDQEQFSQLVREITATLCDLKADVLRQAGDLIGCIAVRIRQIGDRLEEGLIVPTALRRRNWEEVKRLCPESDSSSDRPTHDATWDAIQRNEFVETLKRIVETKVASECQNSAPEEAKRGFRLLDHVFDIAVCMKSLRVNPKKVVTLMTRVQKVIEQIDSSIVAAVRTQARRVRVRCSFRLIDLWTGQIDPWRPPGDAAKSLKESGIQLQLGQRVLCEYPGLADRDDARYACSLNTVGARANYLQAHFSLAYQLLDTAQAAVWPRDRGDDRTSVAVCLMHRAECLMVHADYQLRMKSTREENARPIGIQREIWSTARAKLEGARTELMQAYELLLQGRPNNWWWTWLYTLFAQFHHQWFALCLDAPDEKMWPGPGKAAPSILPFTHPSKRYLADMHVDTADMHADTLNAVRDGLENVRMDPQRHRELCILWWQAFICGIFQEREIARSFWEGQEEFRHLWPGKNEVTDLWKHWEEANTKARFGGFFREQDEAYFEDVVATWGDHEWENLDSARAQRPNAYKHKGRSLRDILLAVENELLIPVLSVEDPTPEGVRPDEPSLRAISKRRTRRRRTRKGP